MSTVAVVGGGVAGLTAAYRLRTRLGPDAEIVLLEQSDALGGKLRTRQLAGCDFDVGAEAFLARRPEVLSLAEELGLADELVHPSPARARIRAAGQLCSLPADAVMGVPASAEAASEVLSSAGQEAVRAEAKLPPVSLGGADVSVGELLRRRVGDEVVDRLVEPLLGGVYAGSADALGLRATVPSLAAAFDAGATSVQEAVIAAKPVSSGAPAPVFGAFRSGYGAFIDRLVKEAAVSVRYGLPVRALTRGNGWTLEIGSAPAPEKLHADAVILAVPPPSARRLLTGVVPAAEKALATVELASMAVVGLALPSNTPLPESSGVLIARGETYGDGTPFTAKAFTFSSRKWPHLRGVNGELLVRGSVGRSGEGERLRMDDAELIRRVRSDLAELVGVDAEPVETTVARWGGGIPQYGPGHIDKVAEIEQAIAGVPGLAYAGAVLHGVGVPACVATGNAAADQINEHLNAS